MFLGGPPLVKMATGEESDDESLGGAEMHARVSGPRRPLRRRRARTRCARPAGSSPASTGARRTPIRAPPSPPKYDEDELLGHRPRRPEDALRPARGDRPDRRRLRLRRVQAAVRAEPGHRLGARCTAIPVGILANAQGVLFSEESQKAAQFIQLANQRDIPLLFLHNTTGYMVGKEYEQGGIIKHGAMMINAVSNSRVPHLSVLMGASYGAGHYGMCGRAYDPRFLFAWPERQVRRHGPAAARRACCRSSPAQSAAAKGQPYDEEADAGAARHGGAADRVRVAADVPVRAAVRRRGHRPARHPHRPRPVPVRDPHAPRSRARAAASASSGCEAAR